MHIDDNSNPYEWFHIFSKLHSAQIWQKMCVEQCSKKLAQLYENSLKGWDNRAKPLYIYIHLSKLHVSDALTKKNK